MTSIWHDIQKSQNHLLGGPQVHRVVGDSRSGRSSSVPDVANLGLARPPLIYLGSIILGMVIHFVWPARLVPPAISTPVGSIVTLAAIALFVSAVRTFREAGTPIPGNRPTTTIVRTGPYRFSRNPIYLAFSFFQLGLSLWVNSVSLLIALVPAVAIMALVVIPRESGTWKRGFPRSTCRTRRRSVGGCSRAAGS
jgi:protein-S-isoprenylcysteine O-methyltransferase Ste14